MMAGPELSRRAVLTGRVISASASEVHVSSLVLHVRPEKVTEVCAALAAMPGVEVPGQSGGRLVVTLETETEGDIVLRMNEMSLLPGVMSAALVYHQVETEPIPPMIE